MATAAAIKTGATATGAGIGYAIAKKISDMSIEEVEKEIKEIFKDLSKSKRTLELINRALEHYR